MTSAPVTVVISRRVRPGAEHDFERWATGVIAAATAFTGHLGAQLVAPRDAVSPYVLIFRFDTEQNLRRWDASDERHAWMEQVETLTDDVQRAQWTGLEHWFGTVAAPRWKMAAVTWAVITPLVLLTQVVLAPVLASVPSLLRLAISTAVTVAAMTWIVMPRITTLLRVWLFTPPHE